LELFIAQFPSHPSVQIRLPVPPEHLKAYGQRDVRPVQETDNLELSIMVAFEGMKFADENQARFSEVFD
jgi:hypothetical protein